MRILVAEDNVVNQKVALQSLARLGNVVEIAANGLEVMRALARQQDDTIFMDVHMPEMDGLQATRAIHSQLPTTQQPVIVAMTAAGMNDFACKPFKREQLLEALARAYAALQAQQPSGAA